ncbi:homoserine kinase type II [Paenibacillus sp. UNCCL117]|uniref:phosphotransferase n=1 Tax=unclassified Paenibacillus TaxID=185978 RepID=UPI00088100F6|nr:MULTISPECIES: phosphotransferase [unclassified Paenibacillus]SDD42280.1 homoserine kinase type II [Paenibacillus sp. cl123]SFW47651.1 homoserine kinase type II [Paenibacillus sp. UNCCL117]
MHTNDNQLAEALRAFLPAAASYTLHAGPSGMNNTTRLAEADGERYVLRVYETHRDASRVEFELDVLKSLSGLALPFHTPVPVAARSGEPWALTGDGKIAVLFRYIEGERPSLRSRSGPFSFGQTTAWLTQALEKTVAAAPPAYPPYYELDQASSAYSLGEALRFCAEPPELFTTETEALQSIGAWLANYRRQLPQLKTLPHQLIHGDLNHTNMLGRADGTITAVLDFEFVTVDLRAMEAAVALSDLINGEPKDDALWPAVESFVRGYAGVSKLSRAEAEALPLLIQLRRVDVFLHFLYRYWDGIDGADTVIRQIRSAGASLAWFVRHGTRLENTLKPLSADSS